MTEMVGKEELPTVERVDDELEKELLHDYRGERSGWYYAGKGKYLLPSRYANEVDMFYNFPVKSDDVWISTFPRSGTTLTQELVWILINNFDFETARKLKLWERSIFFELNLFFHEETKGMFLEENKNHPINQQIIKEMSRPGYETINEMPSPRVIKTHYPLSLLPKGVHEKKAKIIYVARNPKDVAISYYYLFRLWRTSDYISPFTKFWKQFKEGHVPWGPFWAHLQEAWDHQNDDNVLFLFYEDMIKDLGGAILKIAKFLDVAAPLEKIKKLKEHLDIKNFSSNPAVNFEPLRDVGIFSKEDRSFVRKGVAREKSSELTEDIENEIEDWIEENYKFTDLRFPNKKGL